LRVSNHEARNSSFGTRPSGRFSDEGTDRNGKTLWQDARRAQLKDRPTSRLARADIEASFMTISGRAEGGCGHRAESAGVTHEVITVPGARKPGGRFASRSMRRKQRQRTTRLLRSVLIRGDTTIRNGSMESSRA